MAAGPAPADRWARIEALFSAAVDLPVHERETFLNDTCGDDPQVRQEVLSLIRYDTAGEPPLLAALSAGAASVVRDELAPGRMLGPYRIEREIGRGGTAVVYLAVRADGEFQKRVAIKLIRRGMDTTSVVERLRLERRILAALEHPSIARLLDGGTTSDGRPWIAMEYVQGLPIDRYCAQHGLGVEERCLLVAKVCDAVFYAHRNLVVHRDLKPSNILIAPDGNPKLLDFGIAKLLAEDDAGGEGPLTRGPARPLTPEYASPEQITGGSVGTATDIYSLGVVLFELLAGVRPARGGEKAAMKASAAALHADRGSRWAKQLTGDLDTILQKALRPEPERRYLTMGQLQADLERHIAGLPVSARRETLSYRFGKLLKRHPIGATAAALITLAAMGGVAFIMHAERDEQAERQKAEQRLGLLVELANRALLNVHGSIEHLPGATAARLEIVRTTLEYLDRLNAESGQDARVLSAMASAYTRIARVQGSPQQPNLGDQSGALATYEKAARIFDSLVARGEDPDLVLRYAELHLEYGGLLAEVGRPEDALQQYQRGFDQAERVLSGQPRNKAARKLNLRLHLDYSQVARKKNPTAIRQENLKMMPSFEAMVREYPNDTDSTLDLASLWSQIGGSYDQERNLAEAANSYRNSAALRERVYAAHPEDVTVQRDLLIAYGHLGDLTGGPLFPNLGDHRGAVGWYRKAADIAHRMTEADPTNVQARKDEGTAVSRIGIAQAAAGQYTAALETLHTAASFLEPLRANAPTSVTNAQRVSTVYRAMGLAQRGLNQTAAAAESLRRAMAVCQPAISANQDPACQRYFWMAQELLAEVLAEMGDAEAARKEGQSVLASVQEPANHDQARKLGHTAQALMANAALNAALAKHASGPEKQENWRAAAEFYRRALAEWRAFHPDTEPYLAMMRQTEAGIAECMRALKSPAEF